jgi:hypothetical protein
VQIAKRNTYTSDTIQNVLVQMLTHDVHRKNVCDVNQPPYIGIIADGTTDEDGVEQFSFSTIFRSLDIRCTPRLSWLLQSK